MNIKNMVTGTIFIRWASKPDQLLPDGRRLAMFVGVMAVPSEGQQDIGERGEMQFPFAGPARNLKELSIFPTLTMNVSTSEGKDVSNISRGNDLGGLLREPIWRH